ncbi:MAG: cell division protein ZapA [Lysobacteraceae bacterium]|nr:MAG: cell division protein ZapA [Xanthomonadaceae bacterium]
MTDNKEEVVIRILDRELRIGCAAEEKQALLVAAEMVDKQMRTIRDSSRLFGVDKIAMMAALNIANELNQISGQASKVEHDTGDRIARLRAKLDAALAPVVE